jgi:3D (Asp-Asp-Asp) domain-containing protein
MNTLTQKMVNGAISLALLVNVSAVPVATHQYSDVSQIFEEYLQDTSLVAKTPLEEGVKRINAKITAYSSTLDQTDDTPFITASGAHVADGIVAANFLPLHTKLKIPELFGEKVFVVEDRMAKRFQDRVDIWMPDRASAWKFGLRHAEIVVLQ